ncbi:MAG: phosphate ABC transporter ATP-binding protein [Chloroflexaceae bacterium]|nr:phosphate ABC transporter ATP-binding protein [Chloroflexaceae bacterium]
MNGEQPAKQPAAAPVGHARGHSLTVRNLVPFYGKRQAVRPVNLDIPPCQITAIIGPSGCGKSTMLRCLNRMHEMVAQARVEGTVWLDHEDIYAAGVDPRLVRRKIGMVFQHPAVLHTRSIYENVAIGPRMSGITRRRELDDLVEHSLHQAALWHEVQDRLKHPARMLSGGQQQRLSIARTLAIAPDVILFDEPCAALDPIATSKIEELLVALRSDYTLVIVTHNLQQAVRISDRTAVFMIDRDAKDYIGSLVEVNDTAEVFSNPQDPRTQDYISGRVG